MVSQAQMADALGFTLSDLASNRLGHLSVDQSWRCTQAVLTAAGLVIFAISILFSARYMAPPSRLVRVIFVVMGLVFSIVGTAWLWRTSTAAFAKQIISQTGVLSFESISKALNIKIGTSSLIVPRAGETVLTRGDVYRVYYLAHTNTFLSIEKIEMQSNVPR